MAEDSNSENLVLTADGAKMLKEFERMRAEYTRNENAMRKMARSSKEFTDEQLAAMNRMIPLQKEMRETLDKTRQSLIEMGVIQGKNHKQVLQMTPAMRAWQFASIGVAGAIDDLITVASMQNFSMKGWINGFASAANNLSFVIAMWNPWVALAPAGIAAILKIGSSFWNMGEDAKNAGKDAKDAARDFEEAIKTLEKYRLMKVGIEQGDDQVKRIQQEEETKKALDAIDVKLAEAQANLDLWNQKVNEKQVWIPGEAGDTPINRQEEIAQNIWDAQEAVKELEGKKRELIALDNQRLADFEKQVSKKKIINLMGPAFGELATAGGKMLAGGGKVGDIREQFTKMLAGPYGREHGLSLVVDEILRRAMENRVADNFRDATSGRGPLAKVAEEAERKAEEARMRAREAELDDKRPKWDVRRVKDEAQQAGLVAERARIAADQEIEANKSDVPKLLKSIDDSLKNLVNQQQEPGAPVPNVNN